MKTTQPKISTPAAAQHTSTAAPFFQPEASREGFFGSETSQEPFFQPTSLFGNTANPIQAKLSIGQPGDKYEQEADAMADQVVQKLAFSAVQRQCADCAQEDEGKGIALKLQPKSIFESNEDQPVQEKLQRKCAACEAKLIQPMRIQRRSGEEEEPELQAKSDTPGIQASSDLESRLNATKGGGSPLPTETQSSMGNAFGTDFSGVRVHTNSGAVQMNQDLGAQAFTHGSDVYFNSGKYSPGSTEGQRLLGHELTHVVQQGGGGITTSAMQKQPVQRISRNTILRSLLFESTAQICHRVLESRKFHISNGGLRVVLLLNQLPIGEIPNCKNHRFGVSLEKSRDWWPDDEIATCYAETGGARSFSFGNLSTGTYYLIFHRLFDHPYCCLEGDVLVFDEAVSADSSECERDKDPSAMDIVHGALDIAGFIPGLGAIPDGINALIYAAEGDWVNAGISAVAMVPFAGDGAKLALHATKEVVEVSAKSAVKMGEKGMAASFKEAKAAHAAAELAKKAEKEAAEKAAKEAVEKAEKEAAEKGAKEAAEKAEKEAAEKAEKEAAEKAAKKEAEKRIAECEGIHAAYKALGNCAKCMPTDTDAERAIKIACFTAVIAGRASYLAKNCDDILPGSIKRGSAVAKNGHEIQLDGLRKALEKCAKLPTKK